MPSNPNRSDPHDPIEDDDLIGAGDEAEEAEEEDDEDEDDDILDEEDDELDEEDEDEDDVDEEGVEPESVARHASPTDEVGSEGGSPGETAERIASRAGLGRGSEATTTWEGGRDTVRRLVDDADVPVKRAP